jgi:hypothetical protein
VSPDVQWKRLATLVTIVFVVLAASLAGISWHRAHTPRHVLPILIPANPPVRNPR